MRWMTLYLRSRRVPAGIATVIATIAVIWALIELYDNPVIGARLAVVALAAGVAAASTGLGGFDVALDRTAGIAWTPRRGAHVLAIAAAVSGLLALCQAMTATQIVGEVILRDTAGLAGLAALGAVALGGQFAWCPVVGWSVLAVLASDPEEQAVTRVFAWMMTPPDTIEATVVAAVLGVGGALAYSLFGCRPLVAR